MTIIGVTDESRDVVEPFIKKHQVKYLVALGGGDAYRTDGIPHAWLVGPDGRIVWEGHPMELENETIEKHLEGVKL